MTLHQVAATVDESMRIRRCDACGRWHRPRPIHIGDAIRCPLFVPESLRAFRLKAFNAILREHKGDPSLRETDKIPAYLFRHVDALSWASRGIQSREATRDALRVMERMMHLGRNMREPRATEQTQAPRRPPTGHSGPKDTAAHAPRYTMHFDGASRGNPGLAGAGAVIYGPDGREVWSGSEFVGACSTNNEAEYQALILGLREAQARGIRPMAIRGDSQLIVSQMLGRYRVRQENLRPLFREAREISRGLGPLDMEHVRRGFNTRADQLANQAIDNYVAQQGSIPGSR